MNEENLDISAEQVRFLLADVGSLTIAISESEVASVGDAPPVTPVPFMPTSVKGVGQYGGMVLPVFSLANSLSVSVSRETCVIEAVTDEQRVLLEATRAVRWIDVAKDAITEADTQDYNAAFSLSVQHLDHAIPVLDVARYISQMDNIRTGEFAADAVANAQVQTAGSTAEEDDTAPLLICRCGNSRMAIPLASVDHIASLTHLDEAPAAPHQQLGLTVLRGNPVPVYDGAALLDQARDRLADAESLVFLVDQQQRIAIAVSEAEGIRLAKNQQLHETAKHQSVSQLFRDEQDQLIPVISLSSMLDHQLVQPLPWREVADEQANNVVTESFLEVSIAGSPWLVTLDSVEQIVGYLPPSPIASANEGAIIGACEFGGHTVPVIEPTALFGSGPERPEQYLVLTCDEGQVAAPVDQAVAIAHINPADIDSLRQRGGVSRIARRPDGVAKILTAEALQAVVQSAVET